jgi:hypothetical protein
LFLPDKIGEIEVIADIIHDDNIRFIGEPFFFQDLDFHYGIISGSAILIISQEHSG